MIVARVRDFRLDTRLRTACEDDIYAMCAYFGVRAADHGRRSNLLLSCC